MNGDRSTRRPRNLAVRADLNGADPPIRKRGRPSYGVTKRDLRQLKPWVRKLIVDGGQAFLNRYRKPGTLTADRSRADLAAVGGMIAGGWQADKIVAAFCRPDWKIGERFRELWTLDGWDRAVEYLFRTIGKAHEGKTAKR